jgi:hypothetical protein
MSATMAWEDELRSWLEPFLKSYQDLMILAYIEVRWFAYANASRSRVLRFVLSRQRFVRRCHGRKNLYDG